MWSSSQNGWSIGEFDFGKRTGEKPGKLWLLGSRFSLTVYPGGEVIQKDVKVIFEGSMYAV